MRTIGLLHGRDRAFPLAVASAVGRLDPDVAAEPLSVSEARMAQATGFEVILDQASYSVPAARSLLKNAALLGAHVVNDPFWNQAEDRFIATAIARARGVPVPPTEILPNREHVEGVVPESLRNRADPPEWATAVDRLGLPLIIRPAAPRHGVSAVVWTEAALRALWETSGRAQLIAQTFVFPARYLRVLVVGDDALALDWDPTKRLAAGAAGDDVAATAARDAVTASVALGRRINVVDVAVRDGIGYLIDPSAPEPAFEPAELATAFDWAVDKTARLLVGLADMPPEPVHRWEAVKASPRPR